MRYVKSMRTTLTIDDDLLLHARALAEHQQRSIGEVVSELLRKGMVSDEPAPVFRNGIRLLPKRGQRMTLDMVNALRDDDD